MVTQAGTLDVDFFDARLALDGGKVKRANTSFRNLFGCQLCTLSQGKQPNESEVSSGTTGGDPELITMSPKQLSKEKGV
jgi:hypothetical protein